jgi:uncharacterized protein (UPF0335 family)
MTIGHNSKRVKAGPVNADRLKSFVERVENLEEEKKAIGSDIKDVYAEAKGVGYDVKTMRKVVSLRKMDAADRATQEDLLETYLHALGMTMGSAVREVMAGAGVRETATKHGVSRSALSRSVPKSDAPTDLGTGEIPPGEGAADAAKPVTAQAAAPPEVETGGQDVASQDGESRPAPTAPLPLPSTEREAEPGALPKSLYQRITGAFNDPVKEAPDPSAVRAAPENVVAVDPKPMPKEVGAGDPRPEGTPPDDLAFPPYLDRRHERVRG